VAAFGNGGNDRLLLKAMKDVGGSAVAVDNGEGCSIAAFPPPLSVDNDAQRLTAS